jgi:tRNA threonylcarbamoyladenosine biosynthesis protein TsaB
MIIIAIKTDQPESEFILYSDDKILGRIKYLAHRDLGVTIHSKIYQLLQKQNLDWDNLEGIICYSGPGSFTGLRIGLSVANTIAYGLDIPIVGSKGDDWQEKALIKILAGSNDKKVMPFYGAEPSITSPRK